MADVTPITNLRGPAARITDVTAEAVPAGADAEVVMTGPDQNRQFAFKVPRGLPGVNAIENDEAVATYVAGADTDTRAALDAVIGGAVAGKVSSSFVSEIVTDGAAGVLSLVVQPPTSYFTDFTEYPTGAQPADWVTTGAATRLWNVQANGSASGGVDLVASGSSGGSLINPLWQEMMRGQTDFEISWKWTQGSPGGNIRALMYGSVPAPSSGTTPGVANYVTGSPINASTIGFRESIGDVVSTIGSTAAFSTSASTYYIAVVRKVGIWYYGKQWNALDPEPSEWMVSAGSPRLWEGAFGLTSIGGNTQRVDWVGFAVGGASAPRGL